MPHIPDDTAPESWHRYFAMESNNRAWALAVEARSPEQDQELLSSAEASLYHWSKVGTDVHVHRARMLVAESHALLGLGQSALLHARAVAAFFEDSAPPDWERAYISTILAHAAQVAGDTNTFNKVYPEAVQHLEAIADPEDREIVQRTFDQIQR